MRILESKSRSWITSQFIPVHLFHFIILINYHPSHFLSSTRIYSICPVASGLLQRRAGRSSSFHDGTIPASPACSDTHRFGSQAAWPCDSGSSKVALVASRWKDPLQVVVAGSHVASGTHAGIHLGPSDIRCQYSSSIYTACFIVWQPRRAGTRRRIGDRAFSVAAPQAWNRLPTQLKLLRSIDLFRHDLKTVYLRFDSVYGHQDADWLCDANICHFFIINVFINVYYYFGRLTHLWQIELSAELYEAMSYSYSLDLIRLFSYPTTQCTQYVLTATVERKILAFGSEWINYVHLRIAECKLYGTRVWNWSGRISTHLSAIYLRIRRGWHPGQCYQNDHQERRRSFNTSTCCTHQHRGRPASFP